MNKKSEVLSARRRGQNELTSEVIGSAIDVHRSLGPGLLESTYEACLAYELEYKGIKFRLQAPLPVVYKGVNLDCGYRADLVIENYLVVELKAVEALQKIHEAQLLTYMRHAGAPVGLLINFYSRILKDGIKRYVI